MRSSTATGPPGVADLPSVSVIVPVADGAAVLPRCMAALSALSPAPHEVLVVVDGEDRGEAAIAQRAGARVLLRAEQGGPARARNDGAAAATGDVLLFIDADVEVKPDVVGKVAGYLGARRDISAVIGSYDDAPPAANFTSRYKNLLNHFVHQHAKREGETFWGACGAVRRHVYLALGGMRESYRAPSIEDIELGYRLRAAGHRIHVLPDLQVRHLKRWTPRQLLMTDVFRRALPWSALILRTGHLQDDLNVDVPSRIKVAAVCGALLMLLAAPLAPSTLAVAPLLLDLTLLRFYARSQGVVFAVRVIPWHLLYHLYSGLTFAFAVGLYTIGRGSHLASGGRVLFERSPVLREAFSVVAPSLVPARAERTRALPRPHDRTEESRARG